MYTFEFLKIFLMKKFSYFKIVVFFFASPQYARHSGGDVSRDASSWQAAERCQRRLRVWRSLQWHATGLKGWWDIWMDTKSCIFFTIEMYITYYIMIFIPTWHICKESTNLALPQNQSLLEAMVYFLGSIMSLRTFGPKHNTTICSWLLLLSSNLQSFYLLRVSCRSLRWSSRCCVTICPTGGRKVRRTHLLVPSAALWWPLNTSASSWETSLGSSTTTWASMTPPGWRELQVSFGVVRKYILN